MARLNGQLLKRALVLMIAPMAFFGLYGGLSRMGADLPATAAASSFHGALVLHGVFGTLIPLERAVALREPWAFGAPAASMLSGHWWLLVGGLTVLAAPWLANPYDLIIHAICLGFALSMVFGHALIILPAITGIRLAYSAWLYLPLAVLQLSVCLRALGDSLDKPVGRLESGYLAVAALLLFAAILVGRRPRRPILSDQPRHH
jgi:hypothetical protein